ncbi:MAG: hypothetical protein ACYC5W_01360 [Thauera sp.]
MSRSTAEVLLRLEREAWVLEGPGGQVRCALDGALPGAALERLQPAGALRGRRLRVRLGDAWLRYLVVRWPQGVRGAAERAAFLAHRFGEVHGVGAPDWVLAADRDAHDLPALACAAPAAVVAAAQGFAARHGCLPEGIAGDFITAYNALRRRFDEADGVHAALALLRDGRLTVGMWSGGAWAGVRSQAVRDDGTAALRLMLEAWMRDVDPNPSPAVQAVEHAQRGGVVYAAGFAGGLPAAWRRVDVELPA